MSFAKKDGICSCFGLRIKLLWFVDNYMMEYLFLGFKRYRSSCLRFIAETTFQRPIQKIGLGSNVRLKDYFYDHWLECLRNGASQTIIIKQ